MSRIGKQPIAVPTGVEVKLDATGRNIDIKGAQGNLTFHWRPEIEVTHCEDDKQICCVIANGADDNRQNSAFWGTTRARINNMVEGVTKGYEKKLKIVGVGWNAKAQGQTIGSNGYLGGQQESGSSNSLGITARIRAAELGWLAFSGFWRHPPFRKNVWCLPEW